MYSRITVNDSPSSTQINDGISLTKIVHQKTTTFPAAIQPIRPDSLESFLAYSTIDSQQIQSIARPITLSPQEMPIHDAKINPRIIHNRPPLRFDRAFLDNPSNRLKIIQMFCGLFALVLTIHCWPNNWAPYCVGYLWDFWQLFNAVCVHGFFLVGTTFLALAHLFSIPDAFYHYNFPLLEKFYTALAMTMYLFASFFALINLMRASFMLLWIFPVAATLAGFSTYFVDFWTRFRRDSIEHSKSLANGNNQQLHCQQPYIL